MSRKVVEAYLRLRQFLSKSPTNKGLLLVLLDAEDDCPAQLGPQLLTTAKQAQGDADIACVLAKRMFENWIVAGAATLAGVNGLPAMLPAVDNFEERSGSKWLNEQLLRERANRAYKKTVDTLEFVKRIDLVECRKNAPSFDKLCRELEARC